MRYLILPFFLALGFLLPSFADVSAVTCPNANYSIVNGICVPTKAATGLSDAPVADILKSFMNWLLAILGFLGIIAFVISGVQYLVSAGDDDTISAAKRNMKYSIVGVIVALSGYIIIQAVDAALRAPANPNF